MPRRAIKPGNLSAEIQKILSNYDVEVSKNIRQITDAVAKKGAQMLNASSNEKYPGSNYAKGWGVTDASTRVYTSVVIHHKTAPGLPHLLEYGHALKRGGRTIGKGFVDGREHITPVEQEIVKLYTEEVLSKL